jgi:molecular chaperone HtpG
MANKTDSVQTYEYKAEMKQLLDIIIHSLYTHPEIFLRELISNASDALNKVRYQALTDKDILDPDAELKITIRLDPEKRLLSIEDNGIGMTEQELKENLGTVARSGTLEFLQKLKEGKESVSEHLIGQFGVGFYSVFMVADEVAVETRHAKKDAKAYLWKSDGEGSFTIEETERATRGTKVFFTLKETSKEFANEARIKEVITKYSNFADFPIFLGDEKVNTVEALWRKSESELETKEVNEFYKFITNDFEDPLEYMHLSIESTKANFKALIFIPSSAPFDFMRNPEVRSLHLYSNRILIQRDCNDLLPEYLRFIKGVVDTSDLPLNISREVTQSSKVMSEIRNVLTQKILVMLKRLSKKDNEKYLKFFKNFGPLFKTGINQDFTNRDKIIELLRFESSALKEGELCSLKEYTERMQAGQKDIYYISGDNRAVIEKNPNLEYFRKKELEVLYLTDPIDVLIIPSISEYDQKPIKSIEKSDIDLMPEDKVEKPEDNLSKDLLTLFKETLKGKVTDVVPSKRLVDSAVTLVAAKEGMDPQMEKLMKMMHKGAPMPPSPKILEVNTQHPLVTNLSKLYIANKNNPLLEKSILQLYESALLMEGNLSSNTDFVQRMVELMCEATKE